MSPLDELVARTAWHEAGHAMAYLMHRRRFRYITTRPRSPSMSGHVCVRPRQIDPMVRAVMAHCGPQAEGRYLLTATTAEELDADGLTHDDVITGAYLAGGHGDLETIRESLAVYNLPASPDPTEDIARTMIDQQWPIVERLAAALLAHRSLTYDQALTVAQVDTEREHRDRDEDQSP